MGNLIDDLLPEQFLLLEEKLLTLRGSSCREYTICPNIHHTAWSLRLNSSFLVIIYVPVKVIGIIDDGELRLMCQLILEMNKNRWYKYHTITELATLNLILVVYFKRQNENLKNMNSLNNNQLSIYKCVFKNYPIYLAYCRKSRNSSHCYRWNI